MKDFRNKIAYIVGGSSGIGLSVAKLLFEYGAHITIFSRDEHKLSRAIKEISEQRTSTEQTVVRMQMDVADRSMVEQVLETSVRRYGIPDRYDIVSDSDLKQAAKKQAGYFARVTKTVTIVDLKEKRGNQVNG